MLENYAPADHFQFPRSDERTIVIGRTGSGKTFLAVFLLSMADFDRRPWILWDFKGDEFIQQLIDLGYAKLIPLGTIPSEPGLYVVRPVPGRDDIDTEAYLWAIWANENIGIMIDELYMIDPRSNAFNAILTQGRSKNIPMINLTQRPVAVSRWNLSESSHLVVFHLNHVKDRQTVAEHMPIDKRLRLSDYNSRWYDVSRDKLFHVQPAPGREIILQRFKERLQRDETQQPARITLI